MDSKIFENKKVVAVVSDDIAFYARLFADIEYQCLGELSIMRTDPILHEHFSALFDRLIELAHLDDCSEVVAVCLQ